MFLSNYFSIQSIKEGRMAKLSELINVSVRVFEPTNKAIKPTSYQIILTPCKTIRGPNQSFFPSCGLLNANKLLLQCK